MNQQLTPLGATIKSTMDPLRTYFASVGGEGTSAVVMNTKDSNFSKGVRNVQVIERKHPNTYVAYHHHRHRHRICTDLFFFVLLSFLCFCLVIIA